MDQFFEDELRKHYILNVDTCQEVKPEEADYKVYIQASSLYGSYSPCHYCSEKVRECSLPWELFYVKEDNLIPFLSAYGCFENRCVYEKENDYINLEKPLDPFSLVNKVEYFIEEGEIETDPVKV